MVCGTGAGDVMRLSLAYGVMRNMVAGHSARMRLIAGGMLLLTGALAQTGAAGMAYMHGMWIAWFGLLGYLYSLVLCVYLLFLPVIPRRRS